MLESKVTYSRQRISGPVGKAVEPAVGLGCRLNDDSTVVITIVNQVHTPQGATTLPPPASCLENKAQATAIHSAIRLSSKLPDFVSFPSSLRRTGGNNTNPGAHSYSACGQFHLISAERAVCGPKQSGDRHSELYCL